MRPLLSVLLSKVYCFVSWDHRYISFKPVDDPTYFVSYISLLRIISSVNQITIWPGRCETEHFALEWGLLGECDMPISHPGAHQGFPTLCVACYKKRFVSRLDLLITISTSQFRIPIQTIKTDSLRYEPLPPRTVGRVQACPTGLSCELEITRNGNGSYYGSTVTNQSTEIRAGDPFFPF